MEVIIYRKCGKDVEVRIATPFELTPSLEMNKRGIPKQPKSQAAENEKLV